MIVRTRILPPGAIAFTFWPWIFVHPHVADDPGVILHEGDHLDHQRWWLLFVGVPSAVLATCLGVILSWSWWIVATASLACLFSWYVLYLLLLPAGWNLFRAYVERRAMRAEGRCDPEISQALRRRPYYLWWQS